MNDRPGLDKLNPSLSRRSLSPYSLSGGQVWLCLFVVWAVGLWLDRVWLDWDRSLPDQIQATHLNRLLAGEVGWEWVPPLFYRLSAMLCHIFERSDRLQMPTISQACLVYGLLSAVLIGAVYGLGSRLLSQTVGLWAAVLSVCLPAVWPLRLRFGLDYPIVVMVALNLGLLTLWWTEGKSGLLALARSAQSKFIQSQSNQSESNQFRRLGQTRAWLTVLGFGYGLGLGALTSPVTLGYLLAPIGFALGAQLWSRRWGRLLQLLAGLGLAGAIAYPVYRTQALPLLIGLGLWLEGIGLTGLDWARLGDYCRELPQQVFYPIFGLGLVGLLLYRQQVLDFQQLGPWSLNLPARLVRQRVYQARRAVFAWLGVFLLGSIGLVLLGLKSIFPALILPTLPLWIVLLTQGLLQWPGSTFPRSGWLMRWAVLVMLLLFSISNLFPILPFRSANLRPRGAENWQHESALKSITQATPNLDGTVGLPMETPEWNAQTLNYLAQFNHIPITGVSLQQAGPKDEAGLNWYLLKTGESQASPFKPQADLELKQQWKLPDNSDLQLYHRKIPAVVATPIVGAHWSEEKPLKLEKISLPVQAPPGQPIPITYTWAGSLAELRSGLVLLTWKRQDVEKRQDADSQNKSSAQWFHDHAIGLGQLHLGKSEANALFQITETLAMMPPAEAIGTYSLEASYFNRLTGDRYPLIPPSDTITIRPDSTFSNQTSSNPTSIPSIDPVTQLRLLGENLLQEKTLGPTYRKLQALQRIQPNQDYRSQLELAASTRLQDGTQDANLYVAISLTQVLQNQPKNAVKILQELTERDQQNPDALLYLALAALLDLDLSLAQESLQTAVQMQAQSPLIEPLQRIVQGLRAWNWVQAWQGYRSLGI